MWFKNLQLFRLLENPPTEVDVLEEALAKQAFRDCGSLEFSTEGWVSPLSSLTIATVTIFNPPLALEHGSFMSN